MLKRFIALCGLMGIAASGSMVAQVSGSQDELAKALSDNSRWVASVRVKNCKLSYIRPASDPGFRQNSGYPGGGFPLDEASASLSAGPDQSLPRRDTKVEIDLSAFETVNISMRPAFRQKGSTLLWLAVEDRHKVMTVKPADKFYADGVGFVVKSNAAGKTKGLLEKAIADCR